MASVKRYKAFEKKFVTWTMEHPRHWRIFSTMVFVLSLAVQVHGFVRATSSWMQVASVVLGVMLVGVYIGLVFNWRRQDALEELRLRVAEDTDNLFLGEVAWSWGYRTHTRKVREIVGWLSTHNIARTAADDMPQPVRRLVYVLTESL